MSLPILTTVDDVKSLVSYLKNKPTGASLAEAKAAVKKQVLDSRKFTAYTLWGIVTRDGERMKLAQRGWDLARKTRSETTIFRESISSVPPYRSVLEWIFHQGFDSVTNVDVAAHWHEHHSDACGTENESTIKDQAVCFFRLADGAALGSCVIGRHGQATRLELDKVQLAAFIESGPSAPPWIEPPELEEPTPETQVELESKDRVTLTPAAPAPSLPITNEIRVFISHGKNMSIVEQVETMLEMADIKGEVAEEEETAAIPVPEKVLTAMRRCTAGIMVVSVEESKKDSQGNYAINDNVLIEIGAAFVLYDKKVVLVWDKRLKIPSNLQGLYRCEYEGDELTWGAGTKLMKAIKGFRQS